jgi:hypothetical protein
MKLNFYFMMLVLGILSCKAFKKSESNCYDKVINTLISLSQNISMNSESKVYSTNYSAMPNLKEERYLQLCDSITTYVSFLPCDQNTAKQFLYNKQLKSLLNLNCNITVADLRKYFGEETAKGTKKDMVTHLFYYFNNSYKDCYDKKDNNDIYSRCNLLTFIFDSQQRLIEIDPFEL